MHLIVRILKFAILRVQSYADGDDRTFQVQKLEILTDFHGYELFMLVFLRFLPFVTRRSQHKNLCSGHLCPA
jgi:hypothetical protein